MSPLRGAETQVEWRNASDARPTTLTAYRRRSHQSPSNTSAKQADIDGVIAILEEKRTEVMSNDSAGYFILDWQEISDQVRQMIFHDSRYQAIKKRIASRQR